ncbi:MAG: serine/threonine protein kinase [Deltaproteobacteria bacterium]|nr:serine/threonine protein kinase [Deltaproteobacteria bacterium]
MSEERFEIIKPLGQGGTGEVFLATDSRNGEQVALKRIRPSLAADAGAVGRYAQALREAGAVESARLAALRESGQDAQGLFAAWDYVPAGSLQDRIDASGPLSPDEALPICEQVCEALGALHRAGLVHGNVKPSNVLLSSTGARLTDYGSTELIRQDELTLDLASDPAYTAPEMRDLNSRPDARADVYGLAACLHACLTGESPGGGAAWRVPPALRPPLIKAMSPQAADRQPDVTVLWQEIVKARVRTHKRPLALAVAASVFLMVLCGFLVLWLASSDERGSFEPDMSVAVPPAQEPDLPPRPEREPVRPNAVRGEIQPKRYQAELESLHTLETIIHSGYTFGYVKNSSDGPIDKPRIDLRFLDAQERELGRAWGYAEYDLIEPGMRSPIRILSKKFPRGFARVEPEVQIRPLTIKGRRLARLELLDAKLEEGSFGRLDLTGTLRNDEQGKTVKYARAVVVLFDSADRIIEVGSGYAADKELEPGEQSPVSVMLRPLGDEPPRRFEAFAHASVYP